MTDLQQRLTQGLRGRYAIDRELGEGGMAIVYLAHDVRHDRKVALKMLRPEVSAEIGAERFLREVKMAAGLTHPHILPVFDSGEADGLLFYVMPNMAGRSLRERLERERQLPLDEALRITREVASALDYAHRHQVVHRDIKPENILLHDGSAMVADFGIGKALSAGSAITQTGMALGTPMYMSPEQSSGESTIDGRSDLYSLGCVLYEMLTGEPPFTGPTAQAIIAKRFVSPIPSVATTRDVPLAVDRVVTKALARTPVDRYTTAGEFAAVLLELQREGQTPRPEAVTAPPAKLDKAIAVLPFANMSADPENEYFSDGMTEDIINALARLPDVQVASRTSCFAFKGKEVDIREVGDRLGVSSVLEGSVRKIGNRIRVNVQLVDVGNGYQLWSETYDRQLEDVFAIQEEISRAIVDALKVKLIGGATDVLVKPTTENLEAYTLYLKGRFFVNRLAEHDLRKGMTLFEQALDADPGYARAYSGIADCWCNLADDWVVPDDAYPRAKSAATRAIQIEPSLGEAHTSIGKVLCWYEWDFEGASGALAKAVDFNPNYAEAHFVYGSALPAVGRLNEAIEEMRKALVLDPLSAHFSRWLGRFLLYAGRHDAVVEQSRKTLEIEPSYFQAYLDIGAARLAQGQAEEAFKAFQRGQSLSTAVRSYDAMLVRALCALGETEEARAIMERLERQAKEQYLRAEILAMGYGALGEIDRAFACLDQALAAHSAGLIYLHIDPGYESIRPDPRFAKLVARIGLR